MLSSNLKQNLHRHYFDFKQEGFCNFNCLRICKLSELESNFGCRNFQAAQGLIIRERRQFVKEIRYLGSQIHMVGIL